MQMYVSDLLRN